MFKFRIADSADLLKWAAALDSFKIGCIGGVSASEVVDDFLEDGYVPKFGFITKIHPTVTIFDYGNSESVFTKLADHNEVTYEEFLKEMV